MRMPRGFHRGAFMKSMLVLVIVLVVDVFTFVVLPNGHLAEAMGIRTPAVAFLVALSFVIAALGPRGSREFLAFFLLYSLG